MMYPFVHVPSKGLVGSLLNLPLKPAQVGLKMAQSSAEMAKASQTYANGVFSYYFDFMAPYWVALSSFQRTEKKKIIQHQPRRQRGIISSFSISTWKSPGRAFSARCGR